VTYAVRLEPTSVRKLGPVNTLGLDGAVEEDVGQAHDVVVDDTTTGDQARKVSHRGFVVKSSDALTRSTSPILRWRHC
jgi:hypothetical protein